VKFQLNKSEKFTFYILAGPWQCTAICTPEPSEANRGDIPLQKLESSDKFSQFYCLFVSLLAKKNLTNSHK